MVALQALVRRLDTPSMLTAGPASGLRGFLYVLANAITSVPMHTCCFWMLHGPGQVEATMLMMLGNMMRQRLDIPQMLGSLTQSLCCQGSSGRSRLELLPLFVRGIDIHQLLFGRIISSLTRQNQKSDLQRMASVMSTLPILADQASCLEGSSTSLTS